MADSFTKAPSNPIVDRILSRISYFQMAHHWTEYQLAQKSGVPQSTISSWTRKQIAPTLPSLEKICQAFDITLAQFFANETGLTEITPEQQELLGHWETLSPTQKQAFLALMKSITGSSPSS